jgi:hypothetical protein
LAFLAVSSIFIGISWINHWYLFLFLMNSDLFRQFDDHNAFGILWSLAVEDLFRRLAARRGKKRAIIAVAHTMLTIAYLLLKRQETYRDLGADYFDRLNAENIKRSLVRRLERLGNRVILQPTQ